MVAENLPSVSPTCHVALLPLHCCDAGGVVLSWCCRVLPIACLTHSSVLAPSHPSPIIRHNEYYSIFKHGNRNAASHLWVSFLLDRAAGMTLQKLEYMFGGFCAVSGSPTTPGDYNRYRLNLDKVDGSGKHLGYSEYSRHCPSFGCQATKPAVATLARPTNTFTEPVGLLRCP